MQLLAWQVMLCLSVRIVLELLMRTSFTTVLPSAAFPVNGHIEHMGFPHLLNPAFLDVAVDLVLIVVLSFGGSLALQSISLIFLPFLLTT